MTVISSLFLLSLNPSELQTCKDGLKIISVLPALDGAVYESHMAGSQGQAGKAEGCLPRMTTDRMITHVHGGTAQQKQNYATQLGGISGRC